MRFTFFFDNGFYNFFDLDSSSLTVSNFRKVGASNISSASNSSYVNSMNKEFILKSSPYLLKRKSYSYIGASVKSVAYHVKTISRSYHSQSDVLSSSYSLLSGKPIGRLLNSYNIFLSSSKSDNSYGSMGFIFYGYFPVDNHNLNRKDVPDVVSTSFRFFAYEHAFVFFVPRLVTLTSNGTKITKHDVYLLYRNNFRIPTTCCLLYKCYPDIYVKA